MCGVCEFMWDVVRVSGRVCICAVCVVKVCVCVWGVHAPHQTHHGPSAQRGSRTS